MRSTTRPAGATTTGAAFLLVGLAASGLVAACSESSGGDDGRIVETITSEQVAKADTDGTTIRLITHDSFNVSDGLLDSFTAETGITVEQVSSGDAGELVSKAILTAGKPEADVLFGIDNTFLQRGLDAGLFDAYASPALADVPDEYGLDPQHRVTPVDYGDVCVNYWKDGLPGGTPPASMDDLIKPEYASSFVTQDPETSSPGFAFLLATIAAYGDGWEAYWQKLADGGVTVTSGWEDAYYGQFKAGGEGDKTLVTSYASSPVAEVVFSDPKVDTPPTGVVLDSCFRQIEFAGVLAGTEHPEAAAKLIDFLLSDMFQADIPLNMFVSPVNDKVEVPAEYTEFTAKPTRTLSLAPSEIEANRADWTERWSQIVTR
ncbi:MAG: thiamine ABC transporter substrate-binding protein [Acidimicrobiia bacterium]|nr:thiamine ABC transporter substrate-binding protein [Acidimicrobiia bacterium]MDH5289148.1 thiamine ABC transporter substrate-binding protein [Acidimicrobiia bacterium]